MQRNYCLPSETLFPPCRRDSSITRLPEEGDECREFEGCQLQTPCAHLQFDDGVGAVAQAICTAYPKVQRGDCSQILSMAKVLHLNVIAMQLLLYQHQTTSKGNR